VHLPAFPVVSFREAVFESVSGIDVVLVHVPSLVFTDHACILYKSQAP
jgi:hypothetical protein